MGKVEIVLYDINMPPGKTLPPQLASEKQNISFQTRRLLYEEARKPVRADQGTPYPCTQQDLDGYIRHPHPNRDSQYISTVAATNELCAWLNHFHEPDASAMAALDRLKKGIQLKPWKPDLVIKAFKDLDLAFFNGTLTGNVRVKWMCCQEWWRFIGRKSYLGATAKEGHAQCRIVLNAEAILLNPISAPIPFREMWRTMLHEMCVSRERPLSPGLANLIEISEKKLPLGGEEGRRPV
jgi:hypothetical protein